MILSTPMLIADGRAYTLTAHRSSLNPAEYQVALDAPGRDPLIVFCGTGDDLHGLFLGLHAVLIDAGTAGDGQAELIIPGRRPPAEAPGEAPAEGGDYTSGQE